LVALTPEVILLAYGTSTVRPLLQTTRTVPIVFPVISDPVGAGFVDTSRGKATPHNIARQFLWRFLVGRGIQRHRRAANCMPSGNPADQSPGVIATLSQLGHGLATDPGTPSSLNKQTRASGSLATFASFTILPRPSTTQTLESSKETSIPT